MKKKILGVLAVITVFLLFSCLLYTSREPERCPLCNFIKSHAPCLVNVETGEIEEMTLYTPHYTLVGEIAEEQTDSTFSFVDIVGCRGTRLSSPYIMELDVPSTGAPITKRNFCRDCRSLLAGRKGYVIADLYVPGKPGIYEIQNDMHLDIRCYTLTALLDETGKQYQLTVEGTYSNVNIS